jgi:hypothetical protein
MQMLRLPLAAFRGSKLSCAPRYRRQASARCLGPDELPIILLGSLDDSLPGRAWCAKGGHEGAVLAMQRQHVGVPLVQVSRTMEDSAPPPQPPALGAILLLLQFMVPEQLRSTVVQQHVQGHVGRGSPPPRDRALLAPQFAYRERISHPHPPADSRFFGPQCFSLLLARHPWSQREQVSKPSLASSNAIANTRGYTDVMPQYPAENTSARSFSSVWREEGRSVAPGCG